jgi:hypothetical protein
MSDRIAVYISPNERGSDRAAKLAMAIMEDTRYEIPAFYETGIDLQFVLDGLPDYESTHGIEPLADMRFNVELKEPADYVQSALGKDGHLFMQIQTMREKGDRCAVVVTGNDIDISDAIYNALKTRYRGSELHFQMASYEDRLMDFESNSEALGCPVRRWKNPWRRLLSLTHKILTGGSLMGYRPKPANGERDIVAACCLFVGLGPALMATLLEDYRLCFVPKPGARPIEDLPGFGPKRAAAVNARVVHVA